MKKEFDNAKTYTDYETVVLKYASKQGIAETFGAIRVIFDPISEADRDQILASIKTSPTSSKEIVTIQESINGSTAILSVTTKSGLKLTVTLVLEDNQWKVESESF